MVGGTLENKDRLRGGAWTWTSAVLIAQALVSFLSVAPPDPGTFSLSPSENDSKFSPTNEGVFEQTEEPEKKKLVSKHSYCDHSMFWKLSFNLGQIIASRIKTNPKICTVFFASRAN